MTPGLDDRDEVLAVDLEDPVHRREGDRQAALDAGRAAGQPGPGAARDDRDAELGGEPDELGDLGGRRREGDGARQARRAGRRSRRGGRTRGRSGRSAAAAPAAGRDGGDERVAGDGSRSVRSDGPGVTRPSLRGGPSYGGARPPRVGWRRWPVRSRDRRLVVAAGAIALRSAPASRRPPPEAIVRPATSPRPDVGGAVAGRSPATSSRVGRPDQPAPRRDLRRVPQARLGDRGDLGRLAARRSATRPAAPIDRVELNTIAARLGAIRLRPVTVDGARGRRPRSATRRSSCRSAASCRPAASTDGPGPLRRDAAERRSPARTGCSREANGIVDLYRWLPWVSRRIAFDRPNHGDPFVTPIEPARSGSAS